MPTTYQILLARVKQKIATEADWLALSTTLGPIFEGEQCFVYDVSGNPVNFKIGDGVSTFAQLPYFIAYYSNITNLKSLFYLAQTANLTIPSIFKNNSQIESIVLINNSGANIDLKIGTTAGASDICEIIIPVGPATIGLKKFFQAATTLYFSNLTGLNYSLIILYCQLDQAPVIPPSSGVSSAASFAYGTVYAFKPMYAGHENNIWDFTTGLGKINTPYYNCMLFDIGTMPHLAGRYLTGYTVGDTLGTDIGANGITLTIPQLPTFTVNTKIPAERYHTQSGGTDSPYGAASPVRYDNLTSDPIGSGQNIPIRPLSNIVLYFTGPATT